MGETWEVYADIRFSLGGVMYEECIEVVNEIFEFKILTSAAYGQRAAVYRLLSTCLQYSTVEFGRLFCAYFHAIIFSCMKASTA